MEPDDLLDAARSARRLPQLAKIAVLSAAAHPENAELAAAQTLAQLRSEVDALVVALAGAADVIGVLREREKRAVHRLNGRLSEVVEGVAADAIGESFDPTGCFVYLLWGDDDDRPLYVGQSTNVLARLGSHLGNSAKRSHVRRVSLLRCATAKVMDVTEGRLIAQYQPPWNVIGIVGEKPHPGYAPPRALPRATTVGNRLRGVPRPNGLGPQGVPFA